MWGKNQTLMYYSAQCIMFKNAWGYLFSRQYIFSAVSQTLRYMRCIRGLWRYCETNALWSVTPVVWWIFAGVSGDIPSALKMEVTVSSESLLNLCQTTPSYNPEDSDWTFPVMTPPQCCRTIGAWGRRQASLSVMRVSLAPNEWGLRLDFRLVSVC